MERGSSISPLGMHQNRVLVENQNIFVALKGTA